MLHISKKVSLRRNFDKSSFGVRLLLKELQVRQKIYSPISISVMSKNFGKLCKKIPINLIGRDSGRL